jgi:AcrR family transcriptional regulator
MRSTAAPLLDRRTRRRQQTIEEVLDLAAEIMAELGAGGLSVGEVARRMGIRPPSLYVYFPSKHALYDALFARGARWLLDSMRRVDATLAEAHSLEPALLVAAQAFVRWSIEHPAYSQLLYWRPVPGFAPSAEAYQPAVELVELTRRRFAEFQTRGLLCNDAPVEDMLRDWTILTSGVISQQLSNAPHETLAEGHFTSAVPVLVAMFARYYAPRVRSVSPNNRRSNARNKS